MFKAINHKGKLIVWTAVLAVSLSFGALCAHSISKCVHFDRSKVTGTGPLPYNYRVIDAKLHAGGHPLNPATDFRNTDTQALSILKYLKSKGVVTVIDLQNDQETEKRYVKLLHSVGLKWLHVPLSWLKVPTQAQWKAIVAAMKQPVYVHCKWGADRTGLIVAKYLISIKGYSVDEALDAVSTNGSHAGAIRGMAIEYRYDPLFLNFLKQK